MLEAWSDVIPADEVALLETGRGQEIEQPLIDLGYLNEFTIENASQLRTSHISDAIRHFRKDYIKAGLLPDFAHNFSQLPSDELDGLELNLIHQITGLDGEFPVLSLPKKELTNLTSRVLHYRLTILGVFTKSVSVPFDADSELALNTLSTWLMAKNTKDLLNLIGNMPLLLQRILDTNQLKRTAVVFKYKNNKVGIDTIEEVTEEDGDQDNEAQLIEEEAAIDKEIEVLTSTIFSKEEAEIERLEKRNKNKRRRAEKVERCIIELVNQGKELFKETQKQFDKIEQEKQPLLSQKKILDQDILRLSNAIQKEKAKAGPDLKNKAIKRKKKELDKIEKKLKNEKSQAQILGEIGNLEHNISIFKRNVTGLESRPGNHKAVIKRQKDQISVAKKEMDQLNKTLERYSTRKKLRLELQKLEDQATASGQSKAVIQSLQQQEKQTKNLLKEVTDSINQKDKSLQDAIAKRDEIIRQNQLSIKPLKDRLDRLERKISGLKYRFKAQLKRSLDSDFYNELKVQVFESRSKNYLQKLEQDPFNAFLIRLIQVRQWMNGYYYGKLDSQPADRTFQSIVELIEEEDFKRLRLKYVLTKLGSDTTGYWLLNAQYFFDCVCELDKKTSTKNTAELIKAYEDQFDKDPIYKNEVTDTAWKEFTTEIEVGIQEKNTNIRRFYYGVKSLARSIGRVIKNLFRRIVNGVKSVIRIFKNFIKILYKEIREGVRKFFEGMKFLFGKRQIETPIATNKALVTKFDFDFDVTVWATPDIPIDAYKEHITKCAGYAQNLDFSLKLVAKVLKWSFTLASGALTWPRLALKIAFHFKDLVIKFLVKRKIKKTVGIA